MAQNAPRNVGRYLTSEEAVELARIQADNSVIGYALMTMDGDEIESSGAWKSMLAPVFANVFDMADQLGTEFGSGGNHIVRNRFQILVLVAFLARLEGDLVLARPNVVPGRMLGPTTRQR